MPLYEYECDACGHRFEVIQKFADPPVSACAKCGGGPVAKLPSSPAIQFKGSGWYITDYARAGKSDGSASKGSDSKSTSSSGDSKSDKSDTSDTKTESKSDSKPDTKSESKSPAPTS